MAVKPFFYAKSDVFAFAFSVRALIDRQNVETERIEVLNGNGKIDGNEVFGDQTVSPFTGKKLNAANGFEALEQIAKEAKQYTGIDCMNGSQVDIQKLAKALETVGVKLGFISDNNTTELEDASAIKYIDVDNYTENNETGDVQHRQQGSFTDENGNVRKVDDVWFK